MSDNDGHNVVASKIRQQMMAGDFSRQFGGKPYKFDPFDEINAYMCGLGLSVSEAIRRYSNIHGLPEGF